MDEDSLGTELGSPCDTITRTSALSEPPAALRLAPLRSLAVVPRQISTTGTWQTFFSLGGTWADSGEGITVDDQYMYVSARLGSKLAGNTAPVKLSIMGRNATTVPLPAPGVVIKVRARAAATLGHSPRLSVATLTPLICFSWYDHLCITLSPLEQEHVHDVDMQCACRLGSYGLCFCFCGPVHKFRRFTPQMGI